MKLIAFFCIMLLGLGAVGVVAVNQRIALDDEDMMHTFDAMISGGSPTLQELIMVYTDLKEARNDLRMMAESYGIDLPELSQEEKKDLLKTIVQERRQGSIRQEIRDVIADMLIDFGVDLPDLTDEEKNEIRMRIQTMLQDTYGFVFIELTPEQKAYIKQQIIMLKRQGASDEEIRMEIHTLYESYGGVLPDLTDVQREEIREWVHSMLENEYDVDLPDLTTEQRDSLKNQREEIQGLQKDLRDLFKDANKITRWRFLRYVQRDPSS